MCGIAGRFKFHGLKPDPEWISKADRLLFHRGPDGNGHFSDAYCELVHRRLALLDLTPTGHQPMTNEDGSVYVIFNGEIYNHQELRDELKVKDHTFKGTSDTEILVHLYEELGERMPDKLQGMFAFAIYDQRRRCLLLARDRFGIKPLYYSWINNQLIFASEIKAILALSDFKPTIDRQACYDYLGLGYVPEPATAYTEIKALPRGSTLLADADRSRATGYHRTEAIPDTKLLFDKAVESVSNGLQNAVKAQRVADVPVAALLSGGIDSSLVVAAACRHGGQAPQTFNVRFPDAGYDETAMALAVSAQYKTRHKTIELGDYSMSAESVISLLEHFDQPFADTSLIPMYLVSKAIREQGIICALSGDGGDEAFGGYARFWRANRLVKLMKLPDWLQTSAISAGNHLTAVTRNFGRQLSKAIRIAQAGKIDSSVLIASLSNYLSEDQKSELFNNEPGRQMNPVYRHFDGYEPAGTSSLEELSRRMTENLFSVGLVSDMLRKVDMMSMLAGIEVRVPMLDEKIVSIGLCLPHKYKTNGHEGKLVLRSLAERWLPAAVVKHPKHGFGIPLDRVLTDRFHHLLSDMLLSPNARIRSFLDMRIIESWLKMFRAAASKQHGGNISREGLYQRIFIVLSLELWLQKNHFSW